MPVNAPHGRPRDSQRSKLYAAEETLWSAQPDLKRVTRPGIHDAQAFVGRIIGNAWTRRIFPAMPRRVLVTDGRGKRRATAHRTRIDLPAWTRFDMMILHELAHCANYGDKAQAWHGREFAARYLKLVRHFMGKKAHDALRLAFRTHGVKYLAKRTSTAAKTGNLAGLQKARAAKAAKKLNGVLDTALAKLPTKVALQNGSVVSFIESRTPDPLHGQLPPNFFHVGEHVTVNATGHIRTPMEYLTQQRDIALARANSC